MKQRLQRPPADRLHRLLTKAHADSTTYIGRAVTVRFPGYEWRKGRKVPVVRWSEIGGSYLAGQRLVIEVNDIYNEVA